jgi:hypothetical protein
MLGCRSVNTSELLSVLPRQTKDAESKYRYINRWLKNPYSHLLFRVGSLAGTQAHSEEMKGAFEFYSRRQICRSRLNNNRKEKKISRRIEPFLR